MVADMPLQLEGLGKQSRISFKIQKLKQMNKEREKKANWNIASNEAQRKVWLDKWIFNVKFHFVI